LILAAGAFFLGMSVRRKQSNDKTTADGEHDISILKPELAADGIYEKGDGDGADASRPELEGEYNYAHGANESSVLTELGGDPLSVEIDSRSLVDQAPHELPTPATATEMPVAKSPIARKNAHNDS
jgi:hypothetical protein